MTVQQQWSPDYTWRSPLAVSEDRNFWEGDMRTRVLSGGARRSR